MYGCMKGLKINSDRMSESAWLLHSICPSGIACMCGGLRGIANALYIYIYMPVCVCVCVCVLEYLSEDNCTN